MRDVALLFVLKYLLVAYLKVSTHATVQPIL